MFNYFRNKTTVLIGVLLCGVISFCKVGAVSCNGKGEICCEWSKNHKHEVDPNNVLRDGLRAWHIFFYETEKRFVLQTKLACETCNKELIEIRMDKNRLCLKRLKDKDWPFKVGSIPDEKRAKKWCKSIGGVPVDPASCGTQKLLTLDANDNIVIDRE